MTAFLSHFGQGIAVVARLIVSFLPWAAPRLALSGLIGIFIVTGAMGLDFGFHWDEPFALTTISRPFSDGTFLPGAYNYPSMLFDLGSVALLPESAPFLFHTIRSSNSGFWQSYREFVPTRNAAPLQAFAHSDRFLLRLRGVFLLVTSLSGIWVYWAARAFGSSPWEGTFGAAVLLSSWEVAYHSRWVAPDTLLMQFASLYLLFLALALRQRSHLFRWLRLSAAAAGLACGSKYQGGILLLPTLIGATYLLKQRDTGRATFGIVKELVLLVVIFAAVFLLSTPGLVMQPVLASNSLRFIGHEYATGHLGHTVGAFGEHSWLLLIYWTFVFGSHFWPAALVLFACSVVGAVTMWKRAQWETAVVLCGPIAFLLLVVGCHVMIVRNYLLIAPFLAFFCARGAFSLLEALGVRSRARFALQVILAILIMANAAWLFHAAYTIRHRHQIDFKTDIIVRLRQNPRTRYLLSPGVTRAVAMGSGGLRLANVTSNSDEAERYLLFSQEVPVQDYAKWSCNRRGQYSIVSGPLEVNFDYYPNWQGDSRVVELSMQRALEMQIGPKPQG